MEIVNQYKNDLVIVGVGRQTDLALPLILYGKDAYKDVNAFYLMGGAFLVPGNVTPEAEANFYADPIAADSVLEKEKNIYLFPLNVTNKAIIRPETINFIANNTQSPFKDLIKPAYDYYYEAYQKLVPGIQGAPLHDVLVLSVLTNPDLVKYVKRRVRIEQFGKAKGKSIADFRPKPEQEVPETLDDNIAMELDVERFVIDFMEVFLSQENQK
ncbi:nucleoside hydrolase [Cytobacillus firmus]|uniref:nucleoside hydrolase n=1 Tax=Cytobacillus firmus TaxID=1399 RepID=UPI002E247048